MSGAVARRSLSQGIIALCLFVVAVGVSFMGMLWMTGDPWLSFALVMVAVAVVAVMPR